MVIMVCGLAFPIVSRQGSVIQLATVAEARQTLASTAIHLLVVGPRLLLAQQIDLLGAVIDRNPNSINVVLSADTDLSAFQDFIDADQIYYLAKGQLGADAVSSIIEAASRRVREAPQLSPAESSAEADFLLHLSMQQTPTDVSGLIRATVTTRLSAERVQCLHYDPRRDTLYTLGDTSADQGEAAAAGLVGFAIRTGETVALERAGQDPRYDASADDPGGLPDARLIVIPIPGPGPAPLGVITAARSAAAPEFRIEELTILRSLTRDAASKLSELSFQNQLQDRLSQQRTDDLFLQEAAEYHARSQDQLGTVLPQLPRWLSQAHWLNLVLLLVTLSYLGLGRVNDYASGTAVVRSRGRATLIAPHGGLVRGVEVSAGDRVRVGDLLVRLEDPPGASSLERLRGQLRAPHDGVVGDLRVRPGQQVQTGEQLATLVDETAGYELVAFLTGSFAPQLLPGMTAVIKIDGYPESYEVGRVADIGRELVSNTEVSRTHAAAVPPGSVVVAQISLVSGWFEVNGRQYQYRDGLTATAEIAVESYPILFTLVPGLKGAFARFGRGRVDLEANLSATH
jgi:hypothetical protein